MAAALFRVGSIGVAMLPSTAVSARAPWVSRSFLVRSWRGQHQRVQQAVAASFATAEDATQPRRARKEAVIDSSQWLKDVDKLVKRNKKDSFFRESVRLLNSLASAPKGSLASAEGKIRKALVNVMVAAVDKHHPQYTLFALQPLTISHPDLLFGTNYCHPELQPALLSLFSAAVEEAAVWRNADQMCQYANAQRRLRMGYPPFWERFSEEKCMRPSLVSASQAARLFNSRCALKSATCFIEGQTKPVQGYPLCHLSAGERARFQFYFVVNGEELATNSRQIVDVLQSVFDLGLYLPKRLRPAFEAGINVAQLEGKPAWRLARYSLAVTRYNLTLSPEATASLEYALAEAARQVGPIHLADISTAVSRLNLAADGPALSAVSAELPRVLADCNNFGLVHVMRAAQHVKSLPPDFWPKVTELFGVARGMLNVRSQELILSALNNMVSPPPAAVVDDVAAAVAESIRNKASSPSNESSFVRTVASTLAALSGLQFRLDSDVVTSVRAAVPGAAPAMALTAVGDALQALAALGASPADPDVKALLGRVPECVSKGSPHAAYGVRKALEAFTFDAPAVAEALDACRVLLEATDETQRIKRRKLEILILGSPTEEDSSEDTASASDEDRS